MDLEESLNHEKTKREALSKEISKLFAQNGKLKELINSGELSYKTFYLTAIVVLIVYCIFASLLGFNFVNFIVGCFPVQILNAGISLANTALVEKLVKLKINRNEISLTKLKKEKNRCTKMIIDLKRAIENKNNFQKTEEFSKKELLDSLRLLSNNLKENLIDKTPEVPKENKKLI